MNATFKRLYRDKAVVEALRGAIPSINALHRACTLIDEMSYEEFCTKCAYNRAYNKYVIGASHLPENFGEFIETAVMAVDGISVEIKKAYLKVCWDDDAFYYPSKELVAAMLFRVH